MVSKQCFVSNPELNYVFYAAVTDPSEAWRRHVEDSLALLPVLDECCQDKAKIIDVGVLPCCIHNLSTRRAMELKAFIA